MGPDKYLLTRTFTSKQLLGIAEGVQCCLGRGVRFVLLIRRSCAESAWYNDSSNHELWSK